MRLLRKSHLASFVAFLSICLNSYRAECRQMDLKFGAFDLSAHTATQRGGVSNLGSYAIMYHHLISNRLSFGVGYSVLMSDVVGGDLAFGPDIGLFWFPLSRNAPLEFGSERTQVIIKELWRPFVGASFHQRQFQSVHSSYAGFGGSAGVTFAYSMDFDLKAEARYIKFAGPREATATEMNLFSGLVFSF